MGLLAARLACLAGRGLGWLAGRDWNIPGLSRSMTG